jgi:hypothetical protein
MSHRSRRWRKWFSCGHRGFGKYCHCCAQREVQQQVKAAVRREEKQRRKQEKMLGDWDLSKFPKAVFGKVQAVLGKLIQGVHPAVLGGKQLGFDRNIMRIPIGYRHRLLCRREEDGIKPIELLSHEDYNTRISGKNRIS